MQYCRCSRDALSFLVVWFCDETSGIGIMVLVRSDGSHGAAHSATSQDTMNVISDNNTTGRKSGSHSSCIGLTGHVPRIFDQDEHNVFLLCRCSSNPDFRTSVVS